jgi:hypothetical protein
VPSTGNEDEIKNDEVLLHVEYVPGKSLIVGDALSRTPVEGDDRGITEIVEEYVSVVSSLWPASDHQLQRICEETRKDTQLGALLQILQNSWPATKSTLTIELLRCSHSETVDICSHKLMV